eukprot:962811-Pleurochrysis_carterae.AAC.1
MRKRLAAVSQHAATCTISITEAFSLSDAARKLHATAVRAKGGKMAVSVQVNLGKFKAAEKAAWKALMEL